MKKQDLPSKLCPVCGLTFVWRKKWEKNWSEVKYCSDSCRALLRERLSLESPGTSA